MIRQVANHIESIGFKAEMSFGINKSKIDIAVKNKATGNYVLGIVFDETAYVNGNTFVSRELTEKGFTSQGDWKIMRVYTIDWFENQAKTLDSISLALSSNANESLF